MDIHNGPPKMHSHSDWTNLQKVASESELLYLPRIFSHAGNLLGAYFSFNSVVFAMSVQS